MRSVCSFWSLVGQFPCQVTALPPSPCLVWISRHAPRPSLSLSLQSCAWFILPLRPVLLERRYWISSAPRFVGFTVPTVQTRAKSHWETVRFSRAVRFSLPVSAPHRLRCGRLFFPTALNMKEFSIFSVSFWLRTTMSRSFRLSWWSFPILPLSARLP